jgi:hypothetical protein
MSEHDLHTPATTPGAEMYIELGPGCGLEEVTKSCKCDTSSINVSMLQGLSEFSKRSFHMRCGTVSNMFNFATNWQKRVEDCFRDAPLVWSIKTRHEKLQEMMLPLLAELILMDACVFPIHRATALDCGTRADIISTSVVNSEVQTFRTVHKRICSTFCATLPVRTTKEYSTRLKFSSCGNRAELAFRESIPLHSLWCMCVGCLS